MTTKQFILTIAIAVFCIMAPTAKAFAAEPSLDCGLGPTDAGLKVCKAMRQLSLFAAHPVGDADWVIGNANGAIDRGYREGVPGTVLAHMLLPSLITKALFADAERHVVAIELSGFIPLSLIAETKQAIERAAAAGADVADLEKRLAAETAPDSPPPS